MTSANELIDDALEMLGIKSPGDPNDAADQDRMLFVLNALLDELAAEQVFVYGMSQINVALVVNQGSYTIGESGGPTISAPRPPAIAMGPNAAALSSPARGVNYAVNDTGTVTTGSGDATYTISAVAPGGAVAGYNLTSNGTAYTSDAATPTATGGHQPGIGSGFLLNITASDGPITASVLVGSVIGAPVNVVSAIEFKASAAYAPTAGQPDTLNYTDGYSTGTLKVLPAPSAILTLTFQAWARITSFPTLFTAYNLVVGVLDALRQNLAVSGKTYFRDAQIDPLIVQSAVVSRAFLRYQSINSRAMLDRFQLPTNPAKPS